MLPKILIRLSILVLCFTAIPASAEWFEVDKVVPALKKMFFGSLLDIIRAFAFGTILFIKNNCVFIIVISFFLPYAWAFLKHNKLAAPESLFIPITITIFTILITVSCYILKIDNFT